MIIAYHSVKKVEAKGCHLSEKEIYSGDEERETSTSNQWRRIHQ